MRTTKIAEWLLLCAALTQAVQAHQQPTTLAVLDVSSNRVDLNLHVPLTELELAFGHEVSRNPEQTVEAWGPAFRAYLSQHIHPVTTAGQPWSVQVLSLQIGKAEQTQSGPFQEALVHAVLIPPAGGSVRDFILNYDVIMHQVVTHKALFSVHSDWAAGRVDPGGAEPARVGIISVNTQTARVEPLEVHLGAGSLWTGFGGMLRLGMQHIREGTDHLLFLLVLLLPATLVVNGRRWGGFCGSRCSLIRLAKIVTAFTLGHSLTLLLGALHLVKLPQQFVEVMIAFSILITAVHAIRPIFPGREAQVAIGFGLVHGLAFASVLAELKLTALPMALSILGFNLGIEAMQLFVIVLTAPWLILLSLTPAHPSVRRTGAVLAGIASVGWIVNRVSGESNAIERMMNTVTQFAPLAIVILALIAIPSYFYTTFRPAPLAQ